MILMVAESCLDWKGFPAGERHLRLELDLNFMSIFQRECKQMSILCSYQLVPILFSGGGFYHPSANLNKPYMGLRAAGE